MELLYRGEACANILTSHEINDSRCSKTTPLTFNIDYAPSEVV